MSEKVKEIFRFADNNIDFIEPSSILPKTEVIKNTERSLSGRMSVDFIDEKNSFQLLWDIVDGAELENLKTVFTYYKTLTIVYNGNELQCYVDTFDYSPIFIGDTLYFKDVGIELAEI